MAYCDLSYLEMVKPDAVDTVFDGATARATAALESAYRSINDWLGGVSQAKTVPVGTLDDGDYPEALKRLNALMAVYQQVTYYHVEEYGPEYPEWVTRMREEIEYIMTQIENNKINLGFLREAGDMGIEPPEPFGTVFFNNWDTGIYTGNYEREIVVQALDDDTFRWSPDGGLSWEYPTLSIGTSWTDLDWGIKVRWCADYETSMGTQWSFWCYPTSPVSQQKAQAVMKTFVRG